jgi:hypothetical protein
VSDTDSRGREELVVLPAPRVSEGSQWRHLGDQQRCLIPVDDDEVVIPDESGRADGRCFGHNQLIVRA